MLSAAGSLFKRIRNRINGRVRHYLGRWVLSYFYDTPFIYGQCEIVLGKNVSLANTILNARSGRIKVGDNTMFGHNVMLLTGFHDYSITDGFRPTVDDAGRDIEIGDNVWVASGAIVIGPVKIGDGSVIGAGSIVTKDVPAKVLAVGNPAVVIRHL